jgi:hypothetical protein
MRIRSSKTGYELSPGDLLLCDDFTHEELAGIDIATKDGTKLICVTAHKSP